MDNILDAEKVTAWTLHTRSHPTTNIPILPPKTTIRAAESSLATTTNPNALKHATLNHEDGNPDAAVVTHILNDIVPALTGQALTGRYYGFVTGGVLPVAEWADNLVSRVDQNVQVHLPDQTVATGVERAVLDILASWLGLDNSADELDGEGASCWSGRTLTTGATASNILGLACGREAILQKRLSQSTTTTTTPTTDGNSVAEMGLLAACTTTNTIHIKILTSAAHSSISKAASVVGIGRQNVEPLPLSPDQPWRLDLDAVERRLREPGHVSIVAVTVGHVDTGAFALDGMEEWRRLRGLADEFGVWIHVDGAFGIFARLLPSSPEYTSLTRQLVGIHLADSITVDGHKVLNVPYDCGIFCTRSAATLQSVFLNPNAAYLSSNSTSSSTILPSPLNLGLENSRRFRALPLYAAVLSEGRAGFGRLVSNMVQLCRRVAAFLRDDPAYELLPDERASLDGIFIIVLFRARDEALNEVLAERINQTRQMYMSGTIWKGKKAVRIAASSWRVNVERDYRIVTAILAAVAQGVEFDLSKVESYPNGLPPKKAAP